MRLLRDNLLKGRGCRSRGCPNSKGTTAGAGDTGRKKEGVLRTFIAKKDSRGVFGSLSCVQMVNIDSGAQRPKSK